jgi:WD40 repeat protein
MTVLATFALIQRQTAINQTNIARTRQLLAQADALRNRQPDVSLLLNVLALGKAPDAVKAEARSALTINLARPHHIAAQITGHTGPVDALTFSPDGTTLASASWDGTIRLWEAATGHPRGRPITGHAQPADWAPDPVTGVAFSPDGKTLASAADDSTVRLWDVATGQPRGHPLTGHTDSVNEVAFSPDQKTLASASDDGTMRLWDVATGQPRGHPLTGHTTFVNGVTFSPDGTILASASDDGTVRLWDVATGHLRGEPLTGHTGAVNDVAFSPDGKTLASAGFDGTVRLWNVEVKSLIDQACRIANRNMSRTEWNKVVGSEIPYIRICPSS